MGLEESYKRWAYSVFSSHLDSVLPYFDSLKPDIQKAAINISLREYLSMLFVTPLVVFGLEMPLLLLITSLLPGFDMFLSFMFSLSVSLFFSIVTFFLFYIYPSLRVSERKRKIDFVLPFATIYLATASGGNAPHYVMFKVLGEFEEFGELSKESLKIGRDCESFGLSIQEAIKNVAARSPSEEFKELLWGISTTLSAGGNLTQYLHEKSVNFMQDYRRTLEKYNASVTTMLQVYLTLVIVGSIFFIVMTAIMGVFGLAEGFRELIVLSQFLVVFFGLPMISMGFIFVIKRMSPK